MARIPQVTRTIQTTKATALCVDIGSQTTFEKEFILSGTYKDEKSLLKALSKVANDDYTKVVIVKSYEVLETLYGMTEQEFISVAKVLPPRNAK